MQKIVFVGIILLIGLFSLQYILSPLYTQKLGASVKTEKAEEIKLIPIPATFIEPADSTVCPVPPNCI